MCVEATTFVWTTSKASKTALLVLLALADWANEDGEAWPGIKALSEKARMTERNAQIILRKLEASGAIIIKENAGAKTPTGKTNSYIIVGFAEWFKEVKRISSLKSKGVKNSASRGEKFGTKGVKGVSPKPSLEPSEEPLDSIAPASQVAQPSTPESSPIEKRVVDPLSTNQDRVSGSTMSSEKALEPLTPGSAPPPTPLSILAPPGKRWIFRHDNTRHLVNATAKQPQKTVCHQEAGSHALLVPNPLDYVPCAECTATANRSETFTEEIKNAFATLCKKSWNIKANKTAMSNALTQLSAEGPVTIEMLRRFYANWYKCDFRGKEKKAPEPRWVVDHWTEYTESDDCKEGLTNGTADTQQDVRGTPKAAAAPDNGRDAGLLADGQKLTQNQRFALLSAQQAERERNRR